MPLLLRLCDLTLMDAVSIAGHMVGMGYVRTCTMYDLRHDDPCEERPCKLDMYGLRQLSNHMSTHTAKSPLPPAVAAAGPSSTKDANAYCDGHPADGALVELLPTGGARLVATAKHDPLACLPAHWAGVLSVRHSLQHTPLVVHQHDAALLPNSC